MICPTQISISEHHRNKLFWGVKCIIAWWYIVWEGYFMMMVFGGGGLALHTNDVIIFKNSVCNGVVMMSAHQDITFMFNVL